MSAVATRAGRRVAPRPVPEKPRLVASTVRVERIASPAEEVPAEQQQPVLLDVRGAPMAAQQGRTLAVLESLAIGRMVLHVNESVPWCLFPMLETRGVRYDVRSREEGDVRILMWRHCELSGGWPGKMRVERIRVL
jgi:hypothetical protein